VVENGIGATERGSRSRGEIISLTRTMRALQTGESFLLDDINDRAKVHATAHRLGVKVLTEKVTEGLRVWRTDK
jgi:hypothetical protein